MKRLLLALIILAGGVSSSFAACPATSAVLKDNAGSTFNMALTSDANGNCVAKADWDTSSQAHADVTSSIPAGTNRIGYASDDPCASKIKTNLAISQNGTSSVQLIGLSGSTTIYVCSIMLISAGTTTVALTTGTGTACVTNNAAVIGSTTSNIANSMALVANSGWSLGGGAGTVALGVAASELCMILGSNVFVSGNLTYVQQ